jgi:hypothetical protein
MTCGASLQVRGLHMPVRVREYEYIGQSLCTRPGQGCRPRKRIFKFRLDDDWPNVTRNYSNPYNTLTAPFILLTSEDTQKSFYLKC